MEIRNPQAARALGTAMVFQHLILDEPTSVLTPQAIEALFVTLRKLADEGCSILYISHKLDEIRALCHRCTVMRGGLVMGEVDPRRPTRSACSASRSATTRRAGAAARACTSCPRSG